MRASLQNGPRRRLGVAAVLLLAATACTGSAKTTAPEPSVVPGGSSIPLGPVTSGPVGSLVAAASPTDAQSDGWVAESLTAGDDGSGGWAGTAVVRNAQSKARSTNLTFTILAAGQPVATLLGPAASVAGGKTATVKLHAAERFAPGDYQYRFSTGLGF